MNNPTDLLLECCLTALYTTGYTLLKCKGENHATLRALASLQPVTNYIEELKATGFILSPEILQAVTKLVNDTIESAVNNNNN